MQVQAGVRVRHGKHGFLDGDIRRLTIRQDVPGDEGAVIQLSRGLGPACPQQSLVGERSLEADARAKGKEAKADLRAEKKELDADLDRMETESEEAWARSKDAFAEGLGELEAKIREARQELEKPEA